MTYDLLPGPGLPRALHPQRRAPAKRHARRPRGLERGVRGPRRRPRTRGGLKNEPEMSGRDDDSMCAGLFITRIHVVY